jgi:indolepyruvate ferredoxin oxidoreductase
VESRLQSLDDRYEAADGEFFFTGIQAIVRSMLDRRRDDVRAGLRTAAFVSGYPGSPLGGLDRELHRARALLERHDIVHRPGLNEELAATAIMGSQQSVTFPGARYDGVVGYWYGKAPGLDRACDAIRHGVFAGASPLGGAVLLVGDDPGNKSSTLPSASELTLAALEVPILHPGNVQEIVDLMPHAVALSRASGLWTAIRLVSSVADGTGTVFVPAETAPLVPVLEHEGQPYRTEVRGHLVAPYSNTIEEELFGVRRRIALAYGETNSLYGAPVRGDAWLGIVCSGHVYYAVVEALRRLGLELADLEALGVAIVKPALIHPVSPTAIRALLGDLDEVLIVEEKRPFFESAIKDALYGAAGAPRVSGKRDSDGATLVPPAGSLDPDALVDPLRRMLTRRIDESRLRPPARPPALQLNVLGNVDSRTPYFCSGCPHNTSMQTPEGTLVGAGIGCSGMIMVIGNERTGTVTGVTQMGGEGAQWVGAEPFVEPQPFVQNLGDGTFSHSGMLAIRFAVNAGAKLTYKILLNSAIAMTGGQEVPGNLSAGRLARQLLLEGVARVIVTSDDVRRYAHGEIPESVEVWDRDRIVEAQRVLTATEGVTVLIHDQMCAAELRRARKRGTAPQVTKRLVINERVCEGCGDCGVKSNCLSLVPVDTEFGRKTAIHQSSCNLDFSCLKGNCPSFMEVRPARRGHSKQRPPAVRSLVPADVPTPSIATADDVLIRMPGIGGTGVVTVSQILGVAASLDGKFVRGLDNTGMSQKAGPVVSDVRIASHDLESTNVPAAGTVDVCLVFDVLAALSPSSLKGLSRERTVIIGSTTTTPTGAMVADPRRRFGEVASIQAALDAQSRSGENVWFDAQALAAAVCGDAAYANVLQLGAAYQRGLLPLSWESLEEAIELNGVAVERNLQAFRWGRMVIHEPSAVPTEDRTDRAQDDVLPAAVNVLIDALPASDATRRLTSRRATELRRYQSTRYARRYVELVQAVAARGSDELTEAVARGFYALLAYKDEYEVARLLLETAREQAGQVWGDGARVRFYLHPPLLRSFGLQRKILLGAWALPLMQLLHFARCLRGTPLDIFGYAHVRRVERQLIAEYEQTIQELVAQAGNASLDTMIELASLPDLVRGYEEIKLANVARYDERRAELLERLPLATAA